MLPTMEKIQGNFVKFDINEKLGIWFYNNIPIAFRSDFDVFISKNITKRHLKKILSTKSIIGRGIQMDKADFETLLQETFETCNYHVNALKRPTNWAPYLTSMGTP